MKKSLLKNISLNFLMRMISYVFSFITILYITRTLLPEIYGRVSFIGSVAGYFIMFSALGMPLYGLRTCAEHKNDRKDLSRIFNELLSVNILFAFIGIIAMFFSMIFITQLRENYTLLAIYSIGIVLQTMGCEWLYKGLEKFKFITTTLFIVRLISLICILLFVHSGKDMLLYVLISVIGCYGTNIIYFINLPKYVDFSYKLTIKREHIKALFVFFMMSCAVSIYNSLDVTMLGFITNNYETGLYAIAAKIKVFLTMTGSIVCAALLPHVTALWKNAQRSTVFALAEKSITWVFIIQLVLTIFCFIFAKQIILIVGGESYLGCITSLRILLLSLPPIGFSNILGNLVLIPCGFEQKLLKAEIIGAVFNFIANLIIIPIYSGIGAAITTLLSELIVLILCIRNIKHLLNVDFGITMLNHMPKILTTSVNKLKKIFLYNN